MSTKTGHQAWRSAILTGLILALGLGTTTLLLADDAKPASSPPAKPKKQPKTGAELYAIHCNRCHSERYPTEWTEREWPTIMLQMRVRANLPASQSKEILKYLKEESGK